MAMSETAMAALIKSNIEALNNTPQNGQNPVFISDAVLVAFCKGVIDHIKAAQVVVSSGPDPQGGTQVVTSTSIT